MTKIPPHFNSFSRWPDMSNHPEALAPSPELNPEANFSLQQFKELEQRRGESPAALPFDEIFRAGAQHVPNSESELILVENIELKAGERIRQRLIGHLQRQAFEPEEFSRALQDLGISGSSEPYREAALRSDYDWLPEMRFLEDEQLTQARSHFDPERRMLYIHTSLLDQPEAIASIYREVLSHALPPGDL